jgi:hypothetical protein
MKMNTELPRRFWLASGFATAAGILGVITLFWPDWIETVSGWDPDQHDGSVEWMIAAALLIISAAMFAIARIEWRRTAAARS